MKRKEIIDLIASILIGVIVWLVVRYLGVEFGFAMLAYFIIKGK